MKIYNNIHCFIRDYNAKHPDKHYFDRDTLKFFGERLSDMRVYKKTEIKEDYRGKKHVCHVVSKLQRNHPAGPTRTLAYFDAETFEVIYTVFLVKKKQK